MASIAVKPLWGYQQGRFMVDEEHSHLSKQAVHHFHNLVMNALKQ